MRLPAYKAVMVSLADAPPVLNKAETLPLLGTVYATLLNVPAAVLVMSRLPVRPVPLTTDVHETVPLPTTIEDLLQVSEVEVVDKNEPPP